MRRICNNRMGTQMVTKVYVLREVLMIKYGLLEFSSHIVQYSELDDFVKPLAN